MAQNNIGQFSWNPRRKSLPVNPSLPPPDWRQWLFQPGGQLDPQNTGIWDLSGRGRGMGNIPRAIINNSPIPFVARSLGQFGNAEQKALDWAFKTPEGEWGSQGKPAESPSTPASPTFVLPGAASGASTGVAPPAASSPSGDLLTRSKAAIASLESAGSGGYSALGPVTKTGDRGYGKYMVMGANIPQWTQEALGKSMTPQEFLASPDAQEKVFEHRFGGYLNQGSEADAASRWFTGRPAAEGANAQDQLGTSGSSYVNRYLHALGLPGQPPSVEAYQQGMPPGVPNPVDHPTPVGPDFTAQNQFLDSAAPHAVDPALVKKAALERIIAGVGAANANVDVRGPGGVGRLFAAWGAGASGGRAANSADELARAEDLQNQQRQFALQRAGIAGNQSAAEVAWKNSVADTTFQNQAADQGASYENTAKQYEVGQRNAEAGFNAQQENRQNQYKFDEATWQTQKPKVLDTNAKGIVVQNPDGSFQMQSWDQSSGITNLFKKSGLPGPLADVAKYESLKALNDPNIYKKEIMKDLVSSGAAKQVFGANYDNAVKVAQDSIDPALKGEAKTYQAALTEAVTQELWHTFMGNDSWIPNAAAMGNYGAKILEPQRSQQ